MSAMHILGERPGSPLVPTWRVTTAARAFVLALATGQLLGSGAAEAQGITLLAVATVFLVAAVLELDPRAGGGPWGPLVEGPLVAVLIVSAGRADAVAICLVVPPVVAGIRHGWVAAVNSWLLSALAAGAVWTAAPDAAAPAMAVPGLWLAVGLGAGLLAGWLTRSIRDLEANQAPYLAAHRLVAQLHNLSRHVPMGLDSPSVAEHLVGEVRELCRSPRVALLVRSSDGDLVAVTTVGETELLDRGVAEACVAGSAPVTVPGTTALPLRVGDRTFGAVVIGTTSPYDQGLLDRLLALLDEQGLRLDTALLFDDVRALATSEERNRLARDIHDGVAQEIASLGYLVDDLADADDDSARQAASRLRLEITRIVSDLRMSIFDLRQDVDDVGGLSGALAEYVREVSSHSSLRAHLVLDERGAPLPRRTEAELLRITREAVNNVRKHARAENLWVTLVTDGHRVSLTIEDDGVGAAHPRPGHYGLHTMRERADRIHAELAIGTRPEGGTTVSLEIRPSPVPLVGGPHGDARAARR